MDKNTSEQVPFVEERFLQDGDQPKQGAASEGTKGSAPHTFTNYKRHREDHFVDEVRLITRERYKTSGLSGDEWRFHLVLQFYRKGHLLGERAFNGDVGTVLSFAPWVLVDMDERGEFDEEARKLGDAYCFQPGCPEMAVSEYELVEEFGRQGEKLDRAEHDYPGRMVRRRFCRRHLRRGDCGREDADTNYRVISGPGPDDNDWRGARVSEAQRVEVRVHGPEDTAEAVRRVKEQLLQDEKRKRFDA